MNFKTFKTVISILIVVLVFSFQGNAQEMVKTIDLEQTPGAFIQKDLTVSEGTYIFKIKNNNVGKDVGFVLVKKGDDASKPENHIQTAYVTELVKDGKTETSKQTTLKQGEYVYFCPLNNTPMYNLTVK